MSGNDDRVVVPFPVRPAKRHIPTDETRIIVHRAAGLGLTQDQIAHLIGVHPNTLAKRYKVELKTAEAFLNFNVAQNLYSIATNPGHKGAVAAAIFWMKTRGGWREVTRHEHTGEGGGPIQHQVVKADTIDVRTLTAEQREALRATLIEAMAQQALPAPAPDEDAVDAYYEDIEEPAGPEPKGDEEPEDEDED